MSDRMLITLLKSNPEFHSILGAVGRGKNLATLPLTAKLNKVGGIRLVTQSLVREQQYVNVQ